MQIKTIAIAKVKDGRQNYRVVFDGNAALELPADDLATYRQFQSLWV